MSVTGISKRYNIVLVWCFGLLLSLEFQKATILLLIISQLSLAKRKKNGAEVVLRWNEK